MKRSILIVDDEQGVRDLFAFAFEPLGWEVVGAGDGVDAVEKVKERGFDVVVLDQVMPKVSGLDALREMRRFRPTLKVLLLTGATQDRQALEAAALAGGAARCLFKPLELHQLVQAVEQQL